LALQKVKKRDCKTNSYELNGLVQIVIHYLIIIPMLFVLFQVTPSLKECWDHSYQVILSYDDSAASGQEELWPGCKYWWANTSDPNRVVSYLEERKKVEGRPGQSQ